MVLSKTIFPYVRSKQSEEFINSSLLNTPEFCTQVYEGGALEGTSTLEEFSPNSRSRELANTISTKGYET